MGVKITVKDTLSPALQRAYQKLATELHGLIVDAASEIEQRAKHLAPKKYGFLRASIGHYDASQISGTVQKRISGGAVWREKKNDIVMGTSVVYARYQEFGRFEHVEGQSPYMKPAVEQVRPLFQKAVSNLLKECGFR